MKKRFLSILLCLCICFSFLSNIEVSATCQLTNFNTVSLSGNPATDIVKVAEAQIGKTGAQLGATENWCADFVFSCARAAGISQSVIPTTGSVTTMYNQMIASGAYVVTTPQAGDLVFYNPSGNTHVAIMTDSVNSVHGNVNGLPNTVFYKTSSVTKCAYYHYTGSNNIVFVRPNYQGGSSQTPTISVSFPESSRQSIGTTNAILARKLAVSGVSIGSVTSVGITLYDANGNQLARKTETPMPNGSFIEMWYDVNSELGVRLSPGTTYKYRFEAMVAGNLYTKTLSFTTGGSSGVIVDLDPTGGSVSPTSVTITGSTYGTLPTPTRVGYTFSNWVDTNTGSIRQMLLASTPLLSNARHTIYASWTPKTYTVYFNANGGTVSSSSQSIRYDRAYNDSGSLPIPTKYGYDFMGWYTSSTGGSKVTDDTIVSTAGNHTLYARWSGATSWVCFDANGGEVSLGIKPSRYHDTYGHNGSLPIPTREGYNFLGWYTSSTGGSKITDDTIITTVGKHTIYAQWETIDFEPVDIYLDAAGGYFESFGGNRVTGIDQSLVPGKPYGSLPEPLRDGYIFIGWFDSNGKSISAFSIVPNVNNSVIYAQWRKMNYYTITASSGKGGTISPNGTTVVREEDSILYTFTPDDGCKIKEVRVDGEIVHETYNSLNRKYEYLLEDIEKNHTIEVVYQKTGILPFFDVTYDMWSYEDILYAYVKGLMNGTSNDIFDPMLTTNRAMIVTMLYRLEGEPYVSGFSSFDDVDDSQWYAKPFAWAEKNDIVKGYGDGKCGPDDLISREQLATVMYRYAKLKNIDTTGIQEDLSIFSDYKQVSDYAIVSMKWAVSNGLVNGSDNKLMPGSNATREQLAAIFHRFCENLLD